MDTLTYAVLAGLALFLFFLLFLNERRKYQRFGRIMDMDVEVRFQQSEDKYDHMCRGSVVLHLHGCEEGVKAIVIKNLSFSHEAFHVPALDKLYFKGRSSGAEIDDQLLSVSFRVRRHALRRLEGKQLHIQVSGWINDSEGNSKPFKARVPYAVARSSDNEAPMDMTALT